MSEHMPHPPTILFSLSGGSHAPCQVMMTGLANKIFACSGHYYSFQNIIVNIHTVSTINNTLFNHIHRARRIRNTL